MFTSSPAARRLACAVLFAAPLAHPLGAQNTPVLNATNNVYIRGVNDPGSLSQSTLGPVNVGTTHNAEYVNGIQVGVSTNSGTAAALQSTLRASASLSSFSPMNGNWYSHDVKTFADFTKRVMVVAAPNSNLQFGDAVDLSFGIRLDGLARVGFLPVLEPGTALTIPPWNRLLTSADISLNYRVTDLTNVGTVGESAGRPIQIGGFGYGARLILDQARIEDQFGIPGIEYTKELREGWSGFGNVSGSQESAYINDYIGPHTFWRPISTSHTTDVGLLTFRMWTTVGSELEIHAGLDVFLQAMGFGLEGSALGNFLNTFDAELYSDTPGIMILGEERGVYEGVARPPTTVPEPGTWTLMAMGLLAVGVRLRNRIRATPLAGSGPLV